MADPATPPAPLAMKDIITEAGLADRAYLKDYLEKPLDKETALSLLKKVDNAETLIGKKTIGIPEGDDPKQWDEFAGKMRPAKADDYEIVTGEKPDPEFLKAVREAFYDAGIHKTQANRVFGKLIPTLQAAGKAQKEKAAALEAEMEKRDKEFADLLKNMTGPEFDKKSARVQAAVKELVPEQARKFVDKIDDKSLALFVAFADSLLAKYAKEDDFTGNTGGGGGGGAPDKEGLIKELHTLYGSEAWKNFQHADHEKTKKRVDEILASPLLAK
jgi:hypothetical protein